MQGYDTVASRYGAHSNGIVARPGEMLRSHGKGIALLDDFVQRLPNSIHKAQIENIEAVASRYIHVLFNEGGVGREILTLMAIDISLAQLFGSKDRIDTGAGHMDMELLHAVTQADNRPEGEIIIRLFVRQTERGAPPFLRRIQFFGHQAVEIPNNELRRDIGIDCFLSNPVTSLDMARVGKGDIIAAIPLLQFIGSFGYREPRNSVRIEIESAGRIGLIGQFHYVVARIAVIDLIGLVFREGSSRIGH